MIMIIHSEDRVRNGSKKLQKCKHKATQGRLDMFFKPVASPTASLKRKVPLVWHCVARDYNVSIYYLEW